MRIHSSIWNAEEWATKGGRVKTDWSRAPFTAAYRNFNADACIWSSLKGSSCPSNSTKRPWFREKLNTAAVRKLKWAQKYHRVYNYCSDKWRFPEGPGLEYLRANVTKADKWRFPEGPGLESLLGGLPVPNLLTRNVARHVCAD
uniref:xyloglucan:xyloglucosyl transferase n=1 Tax=Lactuca sativa TaxID=4236 RepID=A0A9R1X3U1_LACSA|nr:hypothetical protein LSAT_V11C700363850 [Lactuca sativa]